MSAFHDMSKKTSIQQNDKRNRISNFHKRWNINLSEEDRWENFRSRVLNIYLQIGNIIKNSEEKEAEFFDIIGIHKRVANEWLMEDIFDNGLKKSPTYNYLLDAKDLKKFILGIQVLLWMETLTKSQKADFLKGIQDAVVITGVPLGIKQTETEVVFYPEGAKLLDEKLINDNLDWLSTYSKSYEAFKKALAEVGRTGKEREVVDNLRLSLELLLKDILSNKKSLENQKNEIGVYLKSKNTSTEISNLFWTVLDYYSKYQNNKAKHECTVPAEEVEFILYMTGIMMRFILTR
jgi:hypothetical protein